MKVISCIKPVPDPASRLVINAARTWIKDQELTFVASEADNYALEEALRLKEKHGGEVAVISLGGEEAARVLRSSLAMGADRAIHLLDPKFKDSDEFASAAALAKDQQFGRNRSKFVVFVFGYYEDHQITFASFLNFSTNFAAASSGVPLITSTRLFLSGTRISFTSYAAPARPTALSANPKSAADQTLNSFFLAAMMPLSEA